MTNEDAHERTAERPVAAGHRRGDRAGLRRVVVAPSPDLAYLTGYEPMPLERPTLLVLRADRDPVMLVPELERPLAAASSAGAVVELVGWTDGDDPYTAARRTCSNHGAGSRSATACGPRTSSGCKARCPT